MRHTAYGYWLEEAGRVEPRPALSGDADADVVVVGGGYTGLWCAWHVLQLEPQARVVVLEADRCGHGPSGRNGGFCESLWARAADLRERFGDRPAAELAAAAEASVEAIGRWCAEQGVDAWFRGSGLLLVSAAPAQDHVGRAALEAARALGSPDKVLELDRAQVRSRCDLPAFRRGVLVPSDATVQPARLALGLGDAVDRAGARVFERSRVRSLRSGPDGVVAQTASGRVRARRAVLAVNAATAAVRPVRSRLTVASSHVVVTEPVPDVLEDLGWTGGEAIVDGRRFLHYMRTTPDGRIAFGWAGGRMAAGARLRGCIEVDPGVAAETRRHLLRLFPRLAGREITHAWGGPIDVSPSRLPSVVSLDERVACAFGYTGNGVGPSHLLGRILASLALDRRDDHTRLAVVDPAPSGWIPPEPLGFVGASAVRAATLARERREDLGLPPGRIARAVSDLPRRLGIHVGR